jgi:monovalent cation:H+ antiporter-2, CPA2 family
VVFLMFVIGLEFNLPKLRSMRTLVFGLGLSQVVLTMAGALLGHACWCGSTPSPAALGMGWQGAVVLGGAMAMSSTAIVVKMMAERLELESEHGRRVMGVLLFQDLAVVPLLVLIPALNSSGEDWRSHGAGHVKAAVLLTLLLVGGQRVMRWWLTLVARRKSDELFMLNLLLITLGLAY